jgi:hypothetical protein
MGEIVSLNKPCALHFYSVFLSYHRVSRFRFISVSRAPELCLSGVTFV